jgi:hypothetical protein
MESRTGAVPARSSVLSSRSCDAVGRGLEPHSGRVATGRFQITDPLRPATKQAHQDSNPDQRGWSSSCSRYTTDPKRTTRIERASLGWRPSALPDELRPPNFSVSWRVAACPYAGGTVLGHTARRQEGAQRREAVASPPPAREASAPGWSRTSAPAVSEQCSPLSYGRPEPPAGVEPAPRPYKGRVLAVDTTEAKVEMAGVEPAPPRCKRGALPPELHPQVRTDGVEPSQRGAPGLQPGELTCAQRPRKRGS